MNRRRDFMGYLKDSASLVEIALPGAHNACTRYAGKMARCQNDGVGAQLEAGIRHFCIRLNTDLKGRIWAVHGISKCEPFEGVLEEIAGYLDDERSAEEFFILDIREYYPQKIGPVTLTYRADPKKVDELLSSYIAPEKNALNDFEKISEVTMGSVRASKKRYLLYNERAEYAGSVAPPCIRPWEKKLYGRRAPAFQRALPEFLMSEETEGIYWFQIQQTPGLGGVEIGLRSPARLEREGAPYFGALFETLSQKPYIDRLNVVEGDFMTDGDKIPAILRFNLEKGLVREGLEERFEREFCRLKGEEE